MRLQNVSGIAARLVAGSAGVDVGDDRHVRAELRERFLEAFDAILNAGDLRLVDDRDAAALTDGRTDQLSGLEAALDVVAGDMRDDVPLRGSCSRCRR